MRSTACRSHVSLCSLKTCSLLTAQPDRGALCFLFLFFLISLCLNYCGQAAFGHFSLFLSLSLCGCIMPKQKWHAGNDVMLYWCHSWHHSAWAWVSLLRHKRKTLLLNISSFACGDFFGWWLSQNCKAALSLWLFYAHTHAQMAMAVCAELRVLLMIIDRCACLMFGWGFSNIYSTVWC